VSDEPPPGLPSAAASPSSTPTSAAASTRTSSPASAVTSTPSAQDHELPPLALDALAKAREEVRREAEARARVGAAASGKAPRATRKAAARRRRAPVSPWWRYGFPMVLTLAILAVPVLFYAGYQTVLNSNEGRLVKLPSDAGQPGWEALTEATPTMLVTQVDDEGVPVGATVLSLTGDGTGSVLFIPMNTVLQVPGVGPVRMDEAYQRGGVDGLKLTVEGLLGAGMDETVVVDDEQWASLTQPTAPIVVNNTDAVANGFGKVLIPKGLVPLAPDQVGPFLGTSSRGEDDYNRLLRNENFWKSWLAKVAAAPDDASALPGESDTGFGRFVRRLADSQVEMKTLPLQKVTLPTGDVVYAPVTEEVQSLVAQLIPFPVSPIPGQRLRVRVLDGTGTLDNGIGAAPTLVRGGGQIDAVGNAVRFDYPTTQFVYHADEHAAAVEELRAALGVGELVKTERGNDNADVTVILGQDYAALPAAVRGSVITSPPTVVGTSVVEQGP
jgi:hypothetical protein